MVANFGYQACLLYQSHTCEDDATKQQNSSKPQKFTMNREFFIARILQHYTLYYI